MNKLQLIPNGLLEKFKLYHSVLELAGLWDYSYLRGQYFSAVYDAVNQYLRGNKAITTYKNSLKNSIASSFQSVAQQAWTDAGADLPLDSDTSSYVDGTISSEQGYVDNLFSRLKILRKEEGDNAEYIASGEAGTAADNWSHTLDILYANVKLLAKPNVMLTFGGTDGSESCTDCKRYKGQRHRAKWWVARDAVPPSRSFKCKGYKCQHHLVDDSGRLYTL